MKRTPKTKVVINSGRDWSDRVSRLASDRGVRRQARKATRSVAHGTLRARKLGLGRAAADPRVRADLHAAARAIGTIADRAQPRAKRRRTGKAILGMGVGIVAAGGYAAASKLRRSRNDEDR
jgi:hypothetical protein